MDQHQRAYDTTTTVMEMAAEAEVEVAGEVEAVPEEAEAVVEDRISIPTIHVEASIQEVKA